MTAELMEKETADWIKSVQDTGLDWRKSEPGDHGHLKRARHLLWSGIWSDATFFVGTSREEFKVHKLVLRTGSKVFDDLFNEDKDKSTFEISDVEPTNFYLMLKYMYTGELTQNIEDGLPLLDVASKYEVSDLVRDCGELFADSLTQDNALKIFQQALKYGDKCLEERALKTICSFGYEIIRSTQFLELSVEEICKILARDDLEIPNEAKLFDAVMDWGRAECKRQKTLETHKYLRSVLEKVIHLIRFPQMDSTDFGLRVAPSNILLMEELVSILLYFTVNRDSRASIPTGVFNPKPRIPYTPRGQKFILPRLILNLYAEVMDLSVNSSTGCKYIPPSNVEHSIRFKPSTSIWVTSLAMNCTNSSPVQQHYTMRRQLIPTGVSDDTVLVQIQLKDVEKKALATKTESVSGVQSRTSEVYHVEFENPVFVRKDEWYTASFAVTSGNFYSAPYTVLEGTDGTFHNFILPDRSEAIKFEFRNEEYPKYTTVTQGYIPEIGFMVD